MIRSRSCAFQAATQCSANRCASSLVSIASLRVDMSAVSDSCGPSVPGATADDEQLRDEPFRTHVEIAERPENRPLPPQEDAIILVARPTVPALGEDRVDLLAAMPAPPGFRLGGRSFGRLGYELPGSLRIGVVGDPYLGPELDRR